MMLLPFELMRTPQGMFDTMLYQTLWLVVYSLMVQLDTHAGCYVQGPSSTGGHGTAPPGLPQQAPLHGSLRGLSPAHGGSEHESRIQGAYMHTSA